jgi:hypothetical protein
MVRGLIYECACMYVLMCIYKQSIMAYFVWKCNKEDYLSDVCRYALYACVYMHAMYSLPVHALRPDVYVYARLLIYMYRLQHVCMHACTGP